MGESGLPTLPEAVRLFQLDSMNKLKQTIREQESVIAEKVARVAALERDIAAKDESIANLTAENAQLKGDIVEGERRCAEEKTQCESTVVYMVEVMLQNNQVLEETQNLLEAQGITIKEANEEIKRQRNSSSICQAASDSTAPQAQTISMLRSSLASALEFQELSTSGLDKLNMAHFMTELMDSYNEQTKIIGSLKAVLQNLQGGEVSSMAREMANLASAMRSTTFNLDIVEQQAQVIQKQGKSITQLTPLLRHTSEDIVWKQKVEVGETGVQNVSSCSCLPRSLESSWPKPAMINYQCGDLSDRAFALPCTGGVCNVQDLPSCTGQMDAKWEQYDINGVVTSLNYPNHYPKNHRRTQTIRGDFGAALVLQFTAFNTERGCDFLTITDGDGTTLMSKRSDSSLPPTITSRTNVVKLFFETDGSGQNSGWSVTWKTQRTAYYLTGQ